MLTKLANDYLSMSKKDYVNDRMQDYDKNFNSLKRSEVGKSFGVGTLLGTGMGAVAGYDLVEGKDFSNKGKPVAKKVGKGALIGTGLGLIGGTALGVNTASKLEKERDPIRRNLSKAIGSHQSAYRELHETMPMIFDKERLNSSNLAADFTAKQHIKRAIDAKNNHS